MQPKSKGKKIQSSKFSKKKEFSFPLEKENFMIIGLGILLLVMGYVMMSQNSVDGFIPTVVSPIFLVAGYCVVIPYGIMKKPKVIAAEMKEDSAVAETTSSNVKTS
ncbi:MAG: DUF3098 domain-containing protein [Ignavibacteria bacterium]|nr:DUF3098 domain-containing protein [Ignavibacteria bacterium]